MKYITTILLSILLLSACSSGNNTKQVNENEIITTESFKTFDTIVPFAGTWVSEDYYKCLQETRSTRTAQEAKNVSCIFIPNRTLKTTLMVGDMHDGGAYMHVVKNRDNYEFWADGADEKYFDIQIISANKIKIGEICFVKVSDNNNIQNAINEFVSDMLFKGTYTSDGNNTIEFKQDGRVTGLDDFSYYEPGLDYIGPALDIDQIYLKKSEKKDYYYFAYKFDKDTLLIYENKCIEDYDGGCDKIDFGELKYKLWKK